MKWYQTTKERLASIVAAGLIAFSSLGFTVYSSNVQLTAATPNPEEFYNYTVLLMAMDGADASTTFTDDSLQALSPTSVNGDAQLDTAQYKFGTASAYFDGTGDYLTYAHDTALSADGNPFTYEAHVRLETAGMATRRMVIHKSSVHASTYPNWQMEVNASNQASCWWGPTSGSGTTIAGTTALSANTWYHIACVYYKGKGYIFVDGTKENSGSVASIHDNGAQVMEIGRNTSGNPFPFYGWVDNIRVSRKARYLSNFTAPTAAYGDSAPTSGAVLVSDTFHDQNATTIDSHYPDADQSVSGWTKVGGTAITIDSNQLLTTDDGLATENLATIDHGSTSNVTYYMGTFALDRGTVGSVHRYNTTTDRFMVTLSADTNLLELYENNGSWQLRDSAAYNPNASEPYFYKVTDTGSAITAELDAGIYSVSYSTTENNTYTKTGVRAHYQASRYDYFAVIDGTTEITPVVDTFTDTGSTAIASHTPDTDDVGGGWTAVAGTWAITSGGTAVETTSNAATYLTAVIDSGYANHIVDASCQISATSKAAALVFGYVDSSNYYFAQVDDTVDEFNVYRRVSGSDTKIASTSFSPSTATNYNIKVVKIGSKIIATLDNGNKIYATDTNVTGGTSIGFTAYVPTSGSIQCDNLTVTGIPQ